MQGTVVVADSELHCIVMYTREGTRLRSLCTGGALVRQPVGLEVDCAGRVYVCDQGNARVHVFMCARVCRVCYRNMCQSCMY